VESLGLQLRSPPTTRCFVTGSVGGMITADGLPDRAQKMCS
jgi:hypothetical protein